jgi:neutral ceramidase
MIRKFGCRRRFALPIRAVRIKSSVMPFIFLLAFLWTGSLFAADEVKVGFAERDITPEIGMEQPGGYGKVFHKVLHDPCKARVAVFEGGGKTAALVGVDALMVPKDLVEHIRADVHEKCALEKNSILIGASHSHSSGPTGMVQPGEFDHSSELIQRLAYKESSCADAKYLEKVREEVVAGICEAYERRTNAFCGVGSGIEDKVAFNRRVRMKNGLTYTHPGKTNPDNLGYAGPTDPEVGVLAAWDSHDHLLGCIVNFSCHATTSPNGISANWIYYMEKTIRGALGMDIPVVFLQGDCGDITQVDNLNPAENPSGEKWAQMVGNRVGAEAFKVMQLMPRTNRLSLAILNKTFETQRRRPTADHRSQARQIIDKAEQKPDSADYLFAKETLLLDAMMEKEGTVEVEVQAVQIGPALFVSNPAELFTEYGLRLKQKSPFKFTWAVELANGCIGYVPTVEAFGPHGGGYETRLSSYTNMPIDTGERMTEIGLELARKLKPDPLPEFPRAKKSTPWTYGSLPAQLD